MPTIGRQRKLFSGIGNSLVAISDHCTVMKDLIRWFSRVTFWEDLINTYTSWSTGGHGVARSAGNPNADNCARVSTAGRGDGDDDDFHNEDDGDDDDDDDDYGDDDE